MNCLRNCAIYSLTHIASVFVSIRSLKIMAIYVVIVLDQLEVQEVHTINICAGVSN